MRTGLAVGMMRREVEMLGDHQEDLQLQPNELQMLRTRLMIRILTRGWPAVLQCASHTIQSFPFRPPFCTPFACLFSPRAAASCSPAYADISQHCHVLPNSLRWPVSVSQTSPCVSFRLIWACLGITADLLAALWQWLVPTPSLCIG